MSYRSEITLALTWNTDNRLRDINTGIKQFLDNAGTTINMGKPYFVTVYQWDWIKWYDNPIIEKIEDFLTHLDIKNYLLINIGENLEDMSIKGALENDRIKIMRNVLIW